MRFYFCMLASCFQTYKTLKTLETTLDKTKHKWETIRNCVIKTRRSLMCIPELQETTCFKFFCRARGKHTLQSPPKVCEEISRTGALRKKNIDKTYTQSKANARFHAVLEARRVVAPSPMNLHV